MEGAGAMFKSLLSHPFIFRKIRIINLGFIWNFVLFVNLVIISKNRECIVYLGLFESKFIV